MDVLQAQNYRDDPYAINEIGVNRPVDKVKPTLGHVKRWEGDWNRYTGKS